MLRYATNGTRVCYCFGGVCLFGWRLFGGGLRTDRGEGAAPPLPAVYASSNADAAGCASSVHGCTHGCTSHALTLTDPPSRYHRGTLHTGRSLGTYIFTGDIKEMWLRDSAAQAHPLVAVRAV